MEKINESGVKKVFGKVAVVGAIYTDFKPVAHLTQTITSIYPARQLKTDKSTGLFTTPDEGQKFESVRHCLVAVPKSATVEQVTAELAKYPEGCIQNVLSNDINDVLTSGDRYILEQGTRDLDFFKDKYENRDSDGNRYSRGEIRMAHTGELLREDLPMEFKRSFYQNQYVADVDKRVAVEAAIDLVRDAATIPA
jgi:hypothetical protein